MIRRREFIAGLGSSVAWPAAARAQPANDRVRRVGMLSSLGGAAFEEGLRLFWRELQALGWTERTLRVEARPTNTNDPEVIRPYAEALIGLSPDVILVVGEPATTMLANLTNTIPIIFLSAGDPVMAGNVQSFAHPGGNITGFVSFEASINGKYLQLLKDIAPQVRRVAVVQSRTSLWRDDFSVVQEAARKYAVMPVALVVPDDARVIENELAGFAREADGGLIVPPDVITGKHMQMIADLAAKHRLPAIYFHRTFVQVGGLISFGVPTSLRTLRRIAGYTDRILRGTKVSDLPVQAESTFELVINLKTAKTLGLTIPPNLLAVADEVIE